MHFKLLAVLATALLLTACGSDQTETAKATGSGTVATGSAPTTSQVLPAPGGGTQEDLVVSVGDRIFFGYDQSDIKPEAQSTLEALAAWLNTYPAVTLTLEGHCDERGTREYNLALGERRANAVRDYLIALGIDPNRLGTISFGKERPAVDGSTEQAWAQNRRAVFIVG